VDAGGDASKNTSGDAGECEVAGGDAGGYASKKIPVEILVNVKLLVWMLVNVKLLVWMLVEMLAKRYRWRCW